MIQTPHKAPRIRLAEPILRRLSMPRWSMLAWAILVRLLSLRGVLSLARFVQGLKSPGRPARDGGIGILRQAGKDDLARRATLMGQSRNGSQAHTGIVGLGEALQGVDGLVPPHRGDRQRDAFARLLGLALTRLEQHLQHL